MKSYKYFLQDKYGNSKIQGLKSPLFWFGLGIKLVLSAFFASHYLRDLFTPFVNYFVESGFQNPYEQFNQGGVEEHFPYPSIMLFILSIPRTLFSFLLSPEIYNASALHIFLMRLPLLLFDFIILVVLLRWLKTKHIQVLWLYWLSPIILYINYFHGQLDIIPIGFLIMALYALFKEKWYVSAILLALACAAKTNIAMVLPFFVIYAFKNKKSWMNVVTTVLIFFIVFVIVQLPFLFSDSYIQMVYNNTVQTKVFDAFINIGNNSFLLVIGAYMALLVWSMSFIRINKNLLLLFLAFSFGVLTLFISPMQGWYCWLVPFFIYFVIKFSETQKTMYYVLTGMYFLYFILLPNSDINVFETHSERNVNIAFTLLQSSLALLLFLMYKNGINHLILQKINYKPFLIGVGGDSGAGKSTYTDLINHVVNDKNLTIVRGDDMHKWERGNENWNSITHLNPKANDIHKDYQDTKDLKEGKSIYRKHYDHQHGKFTLPQYISSNTLIVFEGLHPFYLKSQAELYDLKVFLNPDETIRIQRKLKRDVEERDKDPNQVLQQLEDRKEDSDKYIKVQQNSADMVVQFCEINQQLSLRLLVKNTFYVDHLINAIKENSEMTIQHDYLELGQHSIEFSGNIDSKTIELIAYDHLELLEELGIYNSEWQNDYNGIMQLFTMSLIIQSLND